MTPLYALYPVRLNGRGLGDIDSRVKVVNVKEFAPKYDIATTTKTKYDGLRVVKRTRKQRSVEIVFVLWERDVAQRFGLLSAVMEWADGGGALSVGYRDGQQLAVVCEKFPDAQGGKWNEELSLTMTAYDPYWIGIDPCAATFDAPAGQQTQRTLRPGGTAEQTFLEFEIKNMGAAAMTSATVSVGGMAFALSGFSLATGKVLTVAYDRNGFLRFAADGVSVLDKRSGASSDDLILSQREDNLVSVTASQTARVTLKAREQWL